MNKVSWSNGLVVKALETSLLQTDQHLHYLSSI